MVEKIYSRNAPDVLLHIVVRKEDIKPERQHLCPEEEFLHLSGCKPAIGEAVRAHKHLKQIRETNITQESWVVVSGSIKAYFYDLDDQPLKELILKAGDALVSFRGGHKYDCLEEGTMVYEFKTGPYMGKTKDKEFIDGGENA